MSLRRLLVSFSLGLCLLILDSSRSPAEDSDVQPAGFTVEWMKPRPLQDSEIWSAAPDWLREAQIFDELDEKRPKTVPGNQISLTVTRPGLLLIAASWDYDGNASGGWRDSRSTERDLVQQGWERIGTLKRTTKDAENTFQIFRKRVVAGDQVKFHTRKYNPPFVLGIKPQSVAEILAQPSVALASIDLSKLPVPKQTSPLSSDRNLVMLATRDSPHPDRGAERQLIGRELIRQGILLAAREQLGASTRDESLGEAFPLAADGVAPLEVITRIMQDGQLSVTIFRREGERFVLLWDKAWKLSGNLESLPDWPEQLTTISEELSRNAFVDVLKAAGVSGKPNRFLGAGEVPPDVVENLEHLTFAAQIDALRKLHALVRRDGESPERLSALSRGYAQLGSLTEPLWSTAHKAFKARSLLYAERLVYRPDRQGTDHTPLSLWTRAYARALAGRPAAARGDIQRARDRLGKQGATVPGWVPLIDAYCLCDRIPLLEASDRGEQRALARYLLMLSHDELRDEALLVQDVTRLAELLPDNMRAVEMLLSMNLLKLQRNVAQSSLNYFTRRWPQMLQQIESLPEAMQKQLEATPTAKDDDLDFSGPAKFAQALRQTAAHDRQEPSLAVAAQLLEEWAFIRAWREIEVYTSMLGAPADDAVEQLRPLYENHPLHEFLESQVSDRTQRREHLTVLSKSLRTELLDYNAVPLLNALRLEEIEGSNTQLQFVFSRQDDTLYRDLLRLAAGSSTDAFKQRFARMLRQVAPDMRGTISFSLTHDWPEYAADRAAEWERRFQSDPLVLSALAAAYRMAHRPEDAIRCLKQQIELAPEIGTFRTLAECYYEQKKFDAWKETLEKGLEQPALGLEHPLIQADIARHYMRRGQFEQAKPFAEEAANSFASWGLMCAAQCFTGLEEWDEAENYVKANAERYTGAAITWYMWCVSSGHGDRDAARAAARQFIDGLDSPYPIQFRENCATFFALEGDAEHAQEAFSQQFQYTKAVWMAIEAALLADELNKHPVRDRLLKDAVATRNTPDNPRAEVYGKFAGLLQKDLQAKVPGNMDAAIVRESIDSAHEQGQVWLSYFYGRYLTIHGKTAEARPWLQRAATSPLLENYGVTLARDELRKQNIQIEPIRFEKDD